MKRTAVRLAISAAVLAPLVGCGGPGASSAQVRQVRSLVPAARHVECRGDRRLTSCRAIVGSSLGFKRLRCEFSVADGRPKSYSGSGGCWFPEALERPPGARTPARAA